MNLNWSGPVHFIPIHTWINLFYFILAYQIIAEVAYFIKVKGSWYEDVKDKVEFRPIPPYFKLVKLILQDEEKQEIHIRIDENMPVANCRDRVRVNQKAARIITDLFGFDSPGIKTSLVFTVYLIKNCEFIEIARKLIISKRIYWEWDVLKDVYQIKFAV